MAIPDREGDPRRRWPECYNGAPWIDDDLAWCAEAFADFKKLIAERKNQIALAESTPPTLH